MGEIVLSVLAELALAEALKVTKKGISFLIGINSACKKTKETLNDLKLVVDEICESGLESSSEWLSNVEVFRGKYTDGLRLVEECEKTSNRKLLKKFRYAKKIRDLEKYLADFLHTNISRRVTLNIMRLPNISRRLSNLREDVNNINSRLENSRSNAERHEWRHCVPNMTSFLVGFDELVVQLKELVLDTTVNAVGITGLSGTGKSTLATALCHDNQIKGTMDEKQWARMEFPEADALVLNFTASRYSIPTFLHTMKKLKVLIIHNYSARRATLIGLDVFNALSQLNTLYLQKLIVPPLLDYFHFLESLEKLSLSLCEGLGNMSELGGDEFFIFPKILEINVDHCSDLEELPKGICASSSVKKLSVTNCHRLAKLPDEMGNLDKLEELRLCACANLTELPASIRSLQQLEFLDISLCGCLKRLPDGFHTLSSLKALDVRECCKLKRFSQLQALGNLPSLRRVICDKNNEQRLIDICEANSMSNFTVVEQVFSLDWLSD